MVRVSLAAALLLLLAPSSSSQEAAQLPRIDGAKVLMIIASRNFRDEELLIPRTLMTQQGAKVTVASSSIEPARGMLGAEVKPDMLIGAAKPEDFDAIVFVGGLGAKEYWDSPVAHALAKKAFEQHKLVAAICLAPVTLAKAGLLKGRNATVWESEAPQLIKAGAKYTGAPLEVSGPIITADGPKSAKVFGIAIIRALSEKPKPASIQPQEQQKGS